MKSIISFLTLIGFLGTCSIAVPIYNTSFTDSNNCIREKAFYLILADSGDSHRSSGFYYPLDTTYLAMREIAVGLLRMEGTRVGVVLFAGNSDDNFLGYDSMESSFLSRYSEMIKQDYYLGGLTELDDPLQETIGYFSDFTSKEANGDTLLKLVVIQTDSGAKESVHAKRLRDAGVEIFGLGGNALTYSTPLSSHFVPVEAPNKIRSQAVDLLTLLRKQEGDTCFAWGFGQTHVVTFDGRFYDFAGVGDYYLFNSPNNGEDHLSVQVRQYSRSYNEELREGITQIRAVSVTVLEETYIISIDPDTKIFRIQYRESLDDDFYDLEFDISFRPIDDSSRLTTGIYYKGDNSVIEVSKIEPSDTYFIEIKSVTGSIVSIGFSDYSTYISIKPTGTAYGESSGLCGKFDGCPNNDFALRDGTSLSMEVLESSRKMKKYLPEFIENWRLKFSESRLNLKGFEEYLPSESWKPFTSTKSHKNADFVCANLPSILKDECRYDVGARQHVYSSISTQMVMLHICNDYCKNTERKFHSFFEVEESCRLHCESMERPVDLHLRFNISNDSEEHQDKFFEIRGTETSSLFKPNVNMGGKYVFRFRTNDYCWDNERNVTFQITCPKAPEIKAFSYFDDSEKQVEGMISTNSSIFGGSSIILFGFINKIQPEYKISWKVIGGNLTNWDDGKVMTYQQFLDEANLHLFNTKTLMALFKPKRIATYIIEMAVNDGCRVTRANMTVYSKCQKCNPIIEVNRYQKNLWNKPANANGNWQNSYLSLNILSATVSNSYSSKWTLISKDGDIVVPLSTNGVYDIINVIKPRRSINSTTSQVVNKITDEYIDRDGGFPLNRNIPPYVIPEVYAEDRVTDWTDTTETTTIEVFEEEILKKCTVRIFNPSSTDSSIGFTDLANFANDKLAMCKGFYTFEAMVKDKCEPDSTERQAKDSVILHLDCGLPPRIYLSCPHTVDFNYNTYLFPSVTLVGSETYDPIRGKDVNYLRYRWNFDSKPEASTLTLPTPNSNTNSFRPDTRGTYSIRFTASNQCNEESTHVDVYAKCVDPPSVIATPELDTLIYDGVQFNPRFNLTSSSTHQFPLSLVYTWRVYHSPDILPQLVGFVPSSSFATPSAQNTFFAPSIGGKYFVGISVFDRCQPAVSRNLSLTFNCPGTILNIVDPISNFNFNYVNQNFGSFVASGASSNVSSVAYTVVPIHRWSYVSFPVGFSNPGSSSASTYNLIPTVPGTYTIRHQFSDGCQYSFTDVTFQAVCPNTLTSAPVATTTPPFITSKVISLDDSSTSQSVQSYQWRVVLQPKGSNIAIVNANSKVASFTPVISGIYLVSLTIGDGCQTASQNLTLNVVCPTITYAATPIINSPTSLFSRGKFARAELSDTGAQLNGDLPNTYSYIWNVIAAPKGSAFEPYDISNVTSDATTVITNNTVLIPGTTSLYRNTVVIRRTVSSFRWIRYVELESTSNPEKIFSSCFFPDLVGVYRIRLTIAGQGQSTDNECYAKRGEVTVEARCNSAPVINIPDKTIELTQNKLTRVTLDATTTTDAEGDPLKFSWKVLPSSSQVPKDMDISLVSQTESPIASVIIRTQGTYTLELTVTDGCSTTVKNIVINAQCSADDFTLTDKQKKKDEEMRMIVSAYNGAQISRSEFEYLEKSLTENCTGIYEWKLVAFSDNESDIVTVEPFTSTGGFIATVVVVPIVGTIIIVGVVALIVMKLKK